MNKKTLIVGLLTAGILSGAAIIPNSAQAHDRDRYDNYRSYNSRWGELRRDRQELWRDRAELQRDREDLRRLYDRGASRAAIDRKKAEIRDDLREVRESQQELREGYYDYGRDRRYGYDNGWSRNGWWGWWNRR
jgi:chromosome segregation ATPase